MNFTGQIRVPEIDHPGVSATFIVDDVQAEVVLEGESLGRWSLFDVHARRLVASAFQVDLAGEEITFVADDPMDFAYRGVEHMAEVWARFKAMTVARRVVAVARSRRKTTPSQIGDLRTAMLANLEDPRTLDSPPLSDPAKQSPTSSITAESVAKEIDSLGPLSQSSSKLPGEASMPVVASESTSVTPGAATDPVDEEAPAPQNAEVERLEAEKRAIAEERARLDKVREQLAEEEQRLADQRAKAQAKEENRIEAFRLEMQRLEAERAEEKRLEAERGRAVQTEMARLESQRTELEQLEAERSDAARRELLAIDAKRQEIERLEAERAAQSAKEAQRKQADRDEQSRIEAARLAAFEAEQSRLKSEEQRLEAERAEQERVEAERLAQIESEKKKLETARAEQERVEAERLAEIEAEKQRLEAERDKQQKREAKRLAAIQAEEVEQQRLEVERAQREAEEAERLSKIEAEEVRLEEERVAAAEKAAAAKAAEEGAEAAKVKEKADSERKPVKEILATSAGGEDPDSSKELVVDLGELESGKPGEEQPKDPESEPALAGVPREKAGIMGAVKSAFTRSGRNHVHDFVEAPGGIGLARSVCRDCGYVSISSSD